MPVDPKRVQAAFLAAVEEQDLANRAAVVDRECGADIALRQRVEALLRAHDRPDSVLDQPVNPRLPLARGSFTEPGDESAAAVAAEPVDATGDHTPAPDETDRPIPRPIAEGPGTKIGPYKLREKIGEGGMGVVYLAEQEKPVRRRVALKIIKPGMDTEQVVTRFEAERQALALMDHPSIARVLDAGTTDTGRPYFVMELVKGVPITDYCDTVHLTPKERLELFIPVCQAIQHAHQKGIIHRDVKPSNVLVTMQDGKPMPKIIDFGVAKATEQRLTERSLFTQHGTIVGTLEYMSPEQAEMSAMDIDTRTDVYALGVLLYELLTGTTPLERTRLRQAGHAEILRRIREEEPPKPSTRLSESRERLPSVAAQRRTEPARLTKLVRGELDWIVMKAIEKDRTRRYETANGLARDIARYLEGDPVEASPPSTSYRLRKYARKHRGALVTAGAFAALLAAAAAVSTWQAVRARVAEKHALIEAKRARAAEAQTALERDRAVAAESTARDEAAKAKAVNEFLTEDILTQAEPENNAVEDKVTLLEVLDRAAEKVGERFRDQPQVEAELRGTIAATYHGLGSFAKAERHARAQLEIERRLHGGHSREALIVLGRLGHYVDDLGASREAIDLLKEAVDGLSRTLGPDHPATFQSRGHLAIAYRRSGRNAEAIAMHRELLELRTSKSGPDHRATLTNRHNLARDYVAAGRTDEGIATLEDTVKLQTTKLGPDHLDTLDSRGDLANAYRASGRAAEAIAILRELLELFTSKFGPDHPRTLAKRSDLANAYRAAGRTAEAIALFEETLKLQTSKLGPDHQSTVQSRGDLANAYQAGGRTAEAIALLEETVKFQTTKLGPDHPGTFRNRGNLANRYRAAGRTAEAIAIHRELLKLRTSRLGPDHPNTLVNRRNLAADYLAAGQKAEAIALDEETLKLMTSKLGPDDPQTLACQSSLANAYSAATQFDKSEPLYRDNLERARKQFGPKDPRTAQAMDRLGSNLLKLAKWAEAEPLLRECLAIREKAEPDEWTTFDTRSLLGGSLLDQKNYAEAEPLLLSGYEGMKAREVKIPAGSKNQLNEAGERLVKLYEVWGQKDKSDEWRKKLGLKSPELPLNVFAPTIQE